jgi:hypothetical protein
MAAIPSNPGYLHPGSFAFDGQAYPSALAFAVWAASARFDQRAMLFPQDLPLVFLTDVQLGVPHPESHF